MTKMIEKARIGRLNALDGRAARSSLHRAQSHSGLRFAVAREVEPVRFISARARGTMGAYLQ